MVLVAKLAAQGFWSTSQEEILVVEPEAKLEAQGCGLFFPAAKQEKVEVSPRQ